jgi:hypothetical protein
VAAPPPPAATASLLAASSLSALAAALSAVGPACAPGEPDVPELPPCDGPPVTLPEAEPNDDESTAQVLEQEGGDVVLEGVADTCEVDLYEDWFLLDYECGGSVGFHLTWSPAQADLDLYVESLVTGETIVQAQDYGNEPPEEASTEASGALRVVVDCWEGGPVQWTLHVDWPESSGGEAR